jgi:hypothetical protein
VLFFILLLLSLGLLVLFVFGVVALASQDVLSLNEDQWFQSAIIVSSIIFVIAIQVCATVLLFKRYFISWRSVITKIGASDNPSNRSRAQSTCSSEANLITVDRRIKNGRVIPMIVEDVE